MTKDTQAEWQDIIDQFEPEQIAEALQACDGKKWPGKIREILTTAKPKKTLPPTNEDQFSMDQQAAMELIKKFPIKKRRQLEEPQRFALHDVELALKDESPPLLRTALDKWNKANQALANAMAS